MLQIGVEHYLHDYVTNLRKALSSHVNAMHKLKNYLPMTLCSMYHVTIPLFSWRHISDLFVYLLQHMPVQKPQHLSRTMESTFQPY